VFVFVYNGGSTERLITIFLQSAWT